MAIEPEAEHIGGNARGRGGTVARGRPCRRGEHAQGSPEAPGGPRTAARFEGIWRRGWPVSSGAVLALDLELRLIALYLELGRLENDADPARQILHTLLSGGELLLK